jgi:hypothetical protein
MLGTIKSRLCKAGKPSGEVDAMIAAVAMVHKAELVDTGNSKHFQNIEGLKISNWSEPAQKGALCFYQKAQPEGDQRQRRLA